MTETPHSEQGPRLNRYELGIVLRKLGAEVDVEAWDGLTDDQVVSIVSHSGLAQDKIDLPFQTEESR